MIGRMPLVRAVRRRLAGGAAPRPRWDEHGRMFDQALMLVGVYYAITLYLLYSRVKPLAHLEGTTEGMDLMWPVFWLDQTGLALGGQILLHLNLVAGLLGVVLWRSLPVRILVSLALLTDMGLRNSYGSVNHGLHEWFWVSVCFWFLPGGTADEVRRHRAGRMQFLLAFGAAPALILLFYTMSGFYKLFYATEALLLGRFGGFHPEAMATTVAGRNLQTGSSAP